jgi:transcriptional regulator with XRE-family HTH domain
MTGDELYELLSKDPEFRKADRKIKPYYDLIVQVINRRNALNLSKEELSSISGVSKSQLGKIESAEFNGKLSVLIEIAEALECTLDIKLVPIANK